MAYLKFRHRNFVILSSGHSPDILYTNSYLTSHSDYTKVGNFYAIAMQHVGIMIS